MLETWSLACGTKGWVVKSSTGGGGVSQSEVAEGMLVKGDSGNLASSFFLFASWLPGEASLFNGGDFCPWGLSLVACLHRGLAILISLGFCELNGIG